MQCDALTRWPFLADIELPEGYFWESMAGEPAVSYKRSDNVHGFVTEKHFGDGGQLENTVSWSGVESNYDHVRVADDASLQDLCIALANFAWTQP